MENSSSPNQDIQSRIDSLIDILINYKRSEHSKINKSNLIQLITQDGIITDMLFDSLNKKRSNLIEIEDKPFKIISDIFNRILKKMEESNTHNSDTFRQLEYLMILSQTIYKKPKCNQTLRKEWA